MADKHWCQKGGRRVTLLHRASSPRRLADRPVLLSARSEEVRCLTGCKEPMVPEGGVQASLLHHASAALPCCPYCTHQGANGLAGCLTMVWLITEAARQQPASLHPRQLNQNRTDVQSSHLEDIRMELIIEGPILTLASRSPACDCAAARRQKHSHGNETTRKGRAAVQPKHAQATSRAATTVRTRCGAPAPSIKAAASIARRAYCGGAGRGTARPSSVSACRCSSSILECSSAAATASEAPPGSASSASRTWRHN